MGHVMSWECRGGWDRGRDVQYDVIITARETSVMSLGGGKLTVPHGAGYSRVKLSWDVWT